MKQAMSRTGIKLKTFVQCHLGSFYQLHITFVFTQLRAGKYRIQMRQMPVIIDIRISGIYPFRQSPVLVYTILRQSFQIRRPLETFRLRKIKSVTQIKQYPEHFTSNRHIHRCVFTQPGMCPSRCILRRHTRTYVIQAVITHNQIVLIKIRHLAIQRQYSVFQHFTISHQHRIFIEGT